MKPYEMLVAAWAALMIAVPAQAQIARLAGPNPKSPIAEAVTVPMLGFTLYFISGTPASPAKTELPRTDPARMGDNSNQTESSLAQLGEILTQLGLWFRYVVHAHGFP